MCMHRVENKLGMVQVRTRVHSSLPSPFLMEGTTRRLRSKALIRGERNKIKLINSCRNWYGTG